MRVFQDYQVNPGVLIWGGHERAFRLAEAISRHQPVTWAYRTEPPYAIGSFKGKTIWGKDLTCIQGQVGRFRIRLGESENDSFEVGTVIMVPSPSRPVLEYSDVQGKAGQRLLFVLMEVPRATYAEAFEVMLDLANKNRVWVITDQVQVGFTGGEQLYARARERGVVFIRTDRVPLIGAALGYPSRREVRVFDCDLEREISLEFDALIRLKWEQNGDMRYLRLLGLSKDMIDHYPGRTNREGILVFPDPEGFLTRAEEELVIRAIVTRVNEFAGGKARAEKHYYIDAERCALCLTCFRHCPHRAVELCRNESYGNLYQEACQIDDLSCRGCGLCYAECPAQAIVRMGQQPDEGKLPVILACENAASAVSAQFDGNCPYKLFPCSGAINEIDILKAMGDRVGDVYVVACHRGKCQHEGQDRRVEKRVERLNRLLAGLGIRARVHLIRLSAADPPLYLTNRIGLAQTEHK